MNVSFDDLFKGHRNHHQHADDDPYTIKFSKLFTRPKEQWSLREWELYKDSQNIIERKRASEGIIRFKHLFIDFFIERYPFLKPELQKFMGKLTSREHNVIRLYFYNSLRISHIAKELNLSRSSVRTYLARAIQKLRNRLF